ncbi:Lrp/AsnC family transcriptional regulator [Amycolatopsis sp. NPDC059090]|uniref:Lrp/AsnC family transcriptional regulator n=1 Tax=unclassified Amycolatopsis TaxID=2618356 RepID=UPI0036711EA4
MDKTDRAIIHHLLADGRLPNNELADRVGLSPSPCLRRVRALEAAGVITGYHAAVDPAALGRGLEVLLHVEMADQRSEVIEAFEEAVLRLDEVVSCRRMFGTPDYLMQIAVADMAAYEQLYMTELTRMPGVARTNSQFAMKTVKATPGQHW